MAYISSAELRDRLPLDGRGISEGQVEEARASAVEYVAGRTGDKNGASALARQAASYLAQADLLDIVYPRDARYVHAERDSPSSVLREAAERALRAYERTHVEPDDYKGDVPDGYIGTLSWG